MANDDGITTENGQQQLGEQLHEQLDDWKDQLDQRGLTITADELERAIEAAPAEIQGSPDFQFFLGMLYGMQLERGEI